MRRLAGINMFLVIFNQQNGNFSTCSYNRFEKDNENIVFISYHDTQEQAELKTNEHNKIMGVK